jgi:hypothetical protein
MRPVARVDLPQKPICTTSADCRRTGDWPVGMEPCGGAGDRQRPRSALRPRIRKVYDKIAYDRTPGRKWNSSTPRVVRLGALWGWMLEGEATNVTEYSPDLDGDLVVGVERLH